MKLVLDFEQCKKLKELGINYKGEFRLILADNDVYLSNEKTNMYDSIDTLTAQEIICMLPKFITFGPYTLALNVDFHTKGISYRSYEYPDIYPFTRCGYDGKEFIDVLFDFLIDIIESKKLNEIHYSPKNFEI